MEKKKVIRIVLVSPGDLAEERTIVEEVVRELQRVRRVVTIELRKWEDLPPGFYTEGPQTAIEKDLGIQQADLLVAVFWRRYGVVEQPPYSRIAQEIRGGGSV